MRKFLSILTFSLCMTACIYPYTPDLEEAPEGILSVDANISIGETSTVRLGVLTSLFPRNLETWNAPDFSDAAVWLEDDAGTTWPGTLTSSGIYYGYETNGYAGGYYDPYNPIYSIPTENAPGDRRYRLCIEAFGNKYTSDWSELPDPPVITDISFTADETHVTVGVSLDGGTGGTGYFLLSYDEAWEFHVDYIPSYAVTLLGNRVIISELMQSLDMSRYWCWKSQNNQRTYPVDYSAMSSTGVTAYPLFRFERTSNRNHKRYCVNVKAKTISRETYRFLKNLEENTSGGDNLFTPNPGEIAGNLHCESDPERTVLGYVLFSKSTSKRGWLDNKYYRSNPPYPLQFILEDRYFDYYQSGFLPLTKQENPPEDQGPYGWGPPRCYDCTADGGTLTPPSYWYE